MKRSCHFFMLLLLLVLAACDSDNSGQRGISAGGYAGRYPGGCPRALSSTPAALEAAPVTLRVTGQSHSSVEDAYWQTIIATFEKLHPAIHIQWSASREGGFDPSKGNYSQADMPDIFTLTPGVASQAIATNALLNLSPSMARDRVSASDYYPSLLAPFSCNGLQIYGLPSGWSTLGIFYNQRKFRAAQIPMPTEAWTWNDMLTTARKMTWIGETPEYGTMLPADASHWLAFLFSNGGSVLTDNGKRAAFNSSEGVDALNFYVNFERLDHSSVLPSEVGPAWNSDALDAFGQQRASMALEESWLIPYLKAKFPALQYAVAPLPLAPNGQRASMIFTTAWAASSQTKHPAAAWEFIKYVSGREVQRSLLESGFSLPSLKGLADDPSIKQQSDLNVFLQASNYGQLDYFGPHDAFLHDRLNLAIASVLFGQADAQTALNNAAAQVNKVLAS
jgi:multiple sugar transport system substrate-binding protein